MTTRNYSSRSQQTTLTSAVTAGASTMVVQSGTALMGGQSIPAGTTFTIVIDPDTAIEEIVDATAVSTNTLSITRAIDGSSAQAHSAGAVVRHMAIGRDYRESNAHIEASTGVHGISNSSSVVGTIDTQTLTNKTLTAPTITNPSISGAGVDASIVFEGATADAYETTLTVVDPTQDNTITMPNTTGTVVIATAVQTLTNKTLTSPTISGSPVITGLSSAGMSASSATPKDYVDSILGSATAAATSAASAATSATSAATSATSAASSASASATSATASASSATAAATSATSAAASATAAATSATSAAASATTAANSVATIAGYATTASNSASAAATSAASAATSAASAAASTSAAAASATAAATSATSASNSATAAATSATSAATSATAAATSATSAAASAASAAGVLSAAFPSKGALLVGTGTGTYSAQTVGSNGQILTADSAEADGVKWAAAPVSLPDQTGNAGKFLTTDATTASWAVVAGSLAQPTEPTSPTDGQIWVDTDGTALINQLLRWSKAPAGGTTTLSGNDDNSVPLTYSVGYEQVFQNGALLARGSDYTATNGTTISLTNASVTGDIFEVFAAQPVAISDVYTQTQANAAFINDSLLTTTGDTIYASGANTPARLGIGTTGQVLSVSGGVPAWATPALTLIARTSFSNVATQNFDGVFTSTYSNYLVVIDSINSNTGTDDFLFKFRVSGATTTTGYYGISIYGTFNSTSVTNLNTNAASVLTLTPSIGGGTGGGSGYFYASRVGNAAEQPYINGQYFNANEAQGGSFNGTNSNTNLYTGFQLSAASTNITGTVSIYGLAK